MNVLEKHIQNEQSMICYLQEELGNPFLERAEVVNEIKACSERLDALIRLRNLLAVSGQRKVNKNDSRGILERFSDAQSAFLDARGLK